MKRCIVGIRLPDAPDATVSGKQVPNLSRALRMTVGYGLVSIEKNARETQPIALATEFLVVLD